MHRLALVALALALPQAAQAATLYVCSTACTPEAYTSIQAAIDAASEGDTVEVWPGTYNENVEVGKSITVRSTAGSAETIIHGSTNGVLQVRYSGVEALVEGFRVQGGSRAIRVRGGAVATLRDILVQDYSVSNDGAAIRLSSDSTLHLQASHFENVTSSNSDGGGCLLARRSGSVLTIADTTFVNCRTTNSSGDGGAIVVEDGIPVTLERVTVLDSHTRRYGGALAMYGGTLTVIDSHFEGNEADQRGGALYLDGVVATVSGGVFDENSAPLGGHVYMLGGTSLTLDGALLEAAEASTSGGGVIAYGGTLTVNGSIFADNVHDHDEYGGGAIRARDGTAVAVSDSSFLRNHSRHWGGAILVSDGATLSVLNSDFVDNEAAAFGGALAVFTGADLELRGSHFEGNVSESGGALGWWHGVAGANALLVDNAFVSNRSTLAGGGGGALYLITGGVALHANRFEGNTAEGWGGGAYLAWTSSIDARHNDFCENGGEVGGGAGLHEVTTTANTWVNNRFVDNLASAYGGGLGTNRATTLAFNTFAGNGAGTAGGAVASNAGLSFHHNVVTHSPQGDGLVAPTSSTTTFNLFYENQEAHVGDPLTLGDLGEGNLFDVDPAYVDYTPGDGCAADLRPLYHASGLVGAGDPAQKNPDGSAADLGVYGGPDADPAWWEDGDGDGWPWVHDCDDDDEDVHPGADSLCDGLDNNCDGVVDGPDSLDATPWWPDADGDTYGDADADPVMACEQPDGHVDNNLDCDDTDEDVHPGATPQCDGLDNNCDGVIDGPDSVDAGIWYEDHDGDGFGNELVWVIACEQPEGFVSHDDGRPFDCDDEDDTVYPGAPEACDGVDRNCSGTPDDPPPADAPWWWPDADGDGFGDPEGTPIQACSQPEGHADNDLDCDDDDPLTWPGAPESCNGVDNSCNGIPDDPLPEDAPWWWPDADGDGFGDAEADPVQACDQPDGHVDNDLDCDDTDPNVYPGAPEPENDCDQEPVDPGESDRIFEPRDGDLDYGGTGCGCNGGGLGGLGLLPLLLAGLGARRRRA